MFFCGLNLNLCIDVLFAIQTYYTFIVLFVPTIFFMIFAMICNFVQLHKAIKLWVSDIETRNFIQPWIQTHLRGLYAMCILFGSAFTAIEMCNSNLFHLSLFNMGLNRRQKALFKNQRVYSIVLVENVPQLILQFIHAMYFHFSDITIFATVFSGLSIILSFFECFSASILLNAELVTVIKFNLNSHELGSMKHRKYKQLCNYRRDITIEISKIIDIDRRAIELLLPIQTKNGFYLTFQIRSDAIKGKKIRNLIRQEAENGYLGNVIKKVWNLHRVPTIDGLETKELIPDVDLKGKSGPLAAIISLTSLKSLKSQHPLKPALDYNLKKNVDSNSHLDLGLEMTTPTSKGKQMKNEVKPMEQGKQNGDDVVDMIDINDVIIPASTNIGLQMGETQGNLTASVELQVDGSLIETPDGKNGESVDVDVVEGDANGDQEVIGDEYTDARLDDHLVNITAQEMQTTKSSQF